MPQQNVTEPDPESVPPYEGRTTGRDDSDVSEDLTGTVERQMAETKTGRPGATASPADENPVGADEVAKGSTGAGEQSATDTGATTPLGVGTSTTRRGEDVVGEDGEDGRHRTGTQGETQRPVGESTARDSTGIDPQEPAGGPTTPASGSSS
jgi:hypothetical protein